MTTYEAGWYQDYFRVDQLRYFDGDQWTSHTSHPLPIKKKGVAICTIFHTILAVASMLGSYIVMGLAGEEKGKSLWGLDFTTVALIVLALLFFAVVVGLVSLVQSSRKPLSIAGIIINSLLLFQTVPILILYGGAAMLLGAFATTG